jgi:photosystem II stability/assembly factor-like uncharacterized protein
MKPRLLLKQWIFGAVIHLFVVALLVLSCGSINEGNWELVQTGDMPHAAAVASIYFLDANEGWALTWADLYKLRDYGKTWVPVLTNEGGRRAFYSFTFMSSQDGVVVGTQDKEGAYTVLILRTSDAGISWQEANTDVTPQAYRANRPTLNKVAFCDAKNGWAVGDLILHSSDGGLNWITQRSNAENKTLNAIGFLDCEHGWAVGADGLVLSTSDGGHTWIRQELGTKDTLMQVRFFGESGWILGGATGKSVLYRTIDRGKDWQPQLPNVGAALFDIFFLAGHGWIAGENGTILESEDGGRNWSKRQTPTSETLTSIYFLTPDQGWAAGDRKTLLRFVK